MKKIVFSVVFLAALLFSLSGFQQEANASNDDTFYLTESITVYMHGELCLRITCTFIPSWQCSNPGSTWYVPLGGLKPW